MKNKTSVNLTIDIGNTRIKLGIFKKKKLIKKITWNDWSIRQIKELCKKWEIQNIALSTVSDLDQQFERYFSKHFNYLKLSHQTKLPIKNKYRTPKTLGKDRLAAIIGAYSLFPKSAVLVIDAGTCITYDILTKEGAYLGGNIVPGIDMRLKAMHHFTAKLPLVKKGAIKKLVGNTTKSALRTGGQLAAVFEMKGLIEAYSAQFGSIKIILTGGDANFFEKNLKTKIFVNQNLILIGLNKILAYNVQ